MHFITCAFNASMKLCAYVVLVVFTLLFKTEPYLRAFANRCACFHFFAPDLGAGCGFNYYPFLFSPGWPAGQSWALLRQSPRHPKGGPKFCEFDGVGPSMGICVYEAPISLVVSFAWYTSPNCSSNSPWRTLLIFSATHFARMG